MGYDLKHILRQHPIQYSYIVVSGQTPTSPLLWVWHLWPLHTYRTLKVHYFSDILLSDILHVLDCTLPFGRSTMLKYSSQDAGKLDFNAIHMPVASWIDDIWQSEEHVDLE